MPPWVTSDTRRPRPFRFQPITCAAVFHGPITARHDGLLRQHVYRVLLQSEQEEHQQNVAAERHCSGFPGIFRLFFCDFRQHPGHDGHLHEPQVSLPHILPAGKPGGRGSLRRRLLLVPDVPHRPLDHQAYHISMVCPTGKAVVWACLGLVFNE